MTESEFDDSQSSILGTGWSFPPEFQVETGELLMTSDDVDIQASLKILFGTSLGERFLNPKYGLNMQENLFEPMSTTFKTLLTDRIKNTILIYEPRINLLSVELDTSAQYEGKISIIVDYETRGTNSRYNLVYPFYESDSSEVSGPAPFGL